MPIQASFNQSLAVKSDTKKAGHYNCDFGVNFLAKVISKQFYDYRIILQAPIILYFKGLVIRNLEYEVRICKKIIPKSQLQRHCCPGFLESGFIQSNLSIRNFLVALKLFLNAKSSLSSWSKWHLDHMKWSLIPICSLSNRSLLPSLTVPIWIILKLISFIYFRPIHTFPSSICIWPWWAAFWD